MERTVVLTIIFCFLRMSSSLRCNYYKCNPEYSYYDHLVPVCNHFNTSDKLFNVECPKSTMCSVRFTAMDRGNGYIANAAKRDCVFQTVEEQIFVKRKWIFVETTYEPYGKGCFEHPGGEERVTRTVSCYWRRYLCNYISNISISEVTLQGTTPVPDSAVMKSVTTLLILLPFGVRLL